MRFSQHVRLVGSVVQGNFTVHAVVGARHKASVCILVARAGVSRGLPMPSTGSPAERSSFAVRAMGRDRLPCSAKRISDDCRRLERGAILSFD